MGAGPCRRDVISMDVDLHGSLELVADMVDYLDKGYDVELDSYQC